MSEGGNRVGGSAQPLDPNGRGFDPQTEKPGAAPENPGDLPIPDQASSKPELVLRELKDLINSGQDLSKIEESTGLSRDQIEQFVKKFEKPEREAAGEGRAVNSDQGNDQAVSPDRKLDSRVNQPLVSGRGNRGPGAVVQDTMRDQTQGLRSQAPAEIRSRFEAYQSSISRSKTKASPTSKAPAPGSGAGTGK